MKKLIYTAAIISAAAFTACSKGFLDEAPATSQSDEMTLSTYDGLDNSTAGCYSPLASTNWYGQDMILINELKTMEGKKLIGTAYDSGRCISHYQVNWSASNTTALWGTAYYTIVAADEVIDHCDNVDADEQDLANIKAECLFIRALAHFDLVRTYAQPYCYTTDASHAGVPVVTHKDPSGNPARNTVKEVYDQVIADLLEAEDIIDPDYIRDGKDASACVTLEAIQALLARVYLYSEQWQKAADYATKVIDSGKFTLWTADDYKKPETSPFCADTHDGSDEVIFEVYGSIQNSYDGYWDGLANMCGPGTYGDAGATNQLVALYEEGDARANLFVDSSYGTKEDKDALWSAKYLGKGAATPDLVNVIVLRLAEMYLIRAEATALHGATAKATPVQDLTTIASRMGATTQPATPTGIATERIKELCWEAHLWFDLGRTQKDMTRTDETGTNVISEIKWGSKYFAMPIPESQIEVSNGVLVQNEGY